MSISNFGFGFQILILISVASLGKFKVEALTIQKTYSSPYTRKMWRKEKMIGEYRKKRIQNPKRSSKSQPIGKCSSKSHFLDGVGAP